MFALLHSFFFFYPGSLECRIRHSFNISKTKKRYSKKENASFTFLKSLSTVQSPIVLPFKDQASADFLRTQLKDLSMKTNTTIQPVFISHKIERDLKSRVVKPPVVNEQSLGYHFKCDLCDAVMLVLRAATCTNASMSTKTHRHQLENIFARNILWPLKILLITFRF